MIFTDELKESLRKHFQHQVDAANMDLTAEGIAKAIAQQVVGERRKITCAFLGLTYDEHEHTWNVCSDGPLDSALQEQVSKILQKILKHDLLPIIEAETKKIIASPKFQREIKNDIKYALEERMYSEVRDAMRKFVAANNGIIQKVVEDKIKLVLASDV